MVENPTTREIAEFFAMMLGAGWISIPALISWADSLLMEQESPDPALVEISMCGSQKAFSWHLHLHAVHGSLQPEIPAKMLLAYADLEYEIGRKTRSEIAQALYLLFGCGGQSNITFLPETIAKSIHDIDMLADLSTYLRSEMIGVAISSADRPHFERKAMEAERQLELLLRKALDWGREYRDKLPPQCFPPPAESE